MPDIQEQDLELGYECHDCGEVYPPGGNFEACTKEGHYVGKIQACSLPIAPSASKS
jgi:hypothetical protein